MDRKSSIYLTAECFLFNFQCVNFSKSVDRQSHRSNNVKIAFVGGVV